MTDIAYFDYAAMTPVDPRVAGVLREAFEQMPVGNAGATHQRGLAARARINHAREEFATAIGADPREIVFTSGASEADNLAIKGALTYHGAKNPRLITMQTEHKAILDPAAIMAKQGVEVVVLPPLRNGLVDMAALDAALAEKPTTLVSIMAVNNETGVIQPIAEIAERVHAAGAKLHVDAAQAPGRIAVNMQDWQADMVSFAAQKIFGPQGIGALYVRRLPKMRLQAQMHGGGQERGMRSGTLPIALILAFAEAMKLAVAEREARNAVVETLHKQLIDQLPPPMALNSDAPCVPHIINIHTGLPVAQVLALADAAGLALSAGSACSSGGEGSHVLQAMGLGERASQSVRITLSHLTSSAELARLIDFLTKLEGQQ
ncbi:cysteine desulfurase [Cardiobacteriaceae bacterium TAE3-ERU3]|nr:cysteine desulfurase [Cardiobacteriaceae bacterium TAE3-ERU3]